MTKRMEKADRSPGKSFPEEKQDSVADFVFFCAFTSWMFSTSGNREPPSSTVQP